MKQNKKYHPLPPEERNSSSDDCLFDALKFENFEFDAGKKQKPHTAGGWVACPASLIIPPAKIDREMISPSRLCLLLLYSITPA